MCLILTDDGVDDDTTVDKGDVVVVATKLAISSADNLNGRDSFGDITPTSAAGCATIYLLIYLELELSTLGTSGTGCCCVCALCFVVPQQQKESRATSSCCFAAV